MFYCVYKKDYHYNKEYPLELFIKKQYKKKNKKSKNDSNTSKTNLNNNILKENRNAPNVKSICVRKYEELEKIYYKNLKYELQKLQNYDNKNKDNIDRSIILIDKKWNKITLYNAELIYDYYEVYKNFLLYNQEKLLNVNNNDIFKFFRNYIREFDIIYNTSINKTLLTFFKKVRKCYVLVNFISHNKNVKEILIKMFYLMELDIEKIYKLNNLCFEKIKNFLKEKYMIINKNNGRYLPEITYSKIKEKYDPKIIKNIYKDIPLTYLGSKKTLVNTIISKLSFDENINTFVDLFGGSLCVSYVIKTLLPNINIIAYENNKLVMNFYKILKTSYNEFITKLIEIINKLKTLNNKKEYIERMVNIVNNQLLQGIDNPILLACYYYIINKTCYGGIIKYSKENKIIVSINAKHTNTLLGFGNLHKEKLYKYSIFLKNIKLINMDLSKNYKKIMKNINNKTVLYVDPPYDSDNSGYMKYQQVFDRRDHKQLKCFLDSAIKIGCNWVKSNNFTGFISNLYHEYKQNILFLKEKIKCRNKMELLISSF